MKLSFRQADWRRVLAFYSLLLAIGFLIAWPLTRDFKLTHPFLWYWEKYLGNPGQWWQLVMLLLAEFVLTLIVGCCGKLKPTQEKEVVYDSYAFNPFFEPELQPHCKETEEVHCQPSEETTAADQDADFDPTDRTEDETEIGSIGDVPTGEGGSNHEEQLDSGSDDCIIVSDRSFLDQVGVIIPCHKSETVIQDTLKSVLHHVRPEHVIVMDNGKTELPLDDTIIKVREISEEVVYKWVPIGHKGMALLLGNRLLPDTVKYVLLLDDDVQLPKSMLFDDSYFSDAQVSAISYAIGACGHDGTANTMNCVQRLTDFEFKFADTFRAFVSRFSTVMFAHGAIGLWRRDRFNEIYENHPGLPIGEDGWAGRLNLMKGYSMKQDSGPLITTESPPKLFPESCWSWMVCSEGEAGRTKETILDSKQNTEVVAGFGSPDLFNQRARRWDMNAPRRIPCHVKLFFTYGWGQLCKLSDFKKCDLLPGLLFFLLARVGIARGAWALFKAYFLFGYLVHTIIHARACWALLGLVAIYALQVFKYILVNHWLWRKRKDLQVSWGTVFLFPIYRSIMAVFRFYGYWRSLLMYIPLVKSPKHVLGKTKEAAKLMKMLQKQQEIDIWPVNCDEPFEHDDSSFASQGSEDSHYVQWA